MPELKLKFDQHGLGDVCHAILMLQLWRTRGYDITVQVEKNKIPLWRIAGVDLVQGGDLPNHSYGYPAGFDDLNQPDWRCNKVSHGIMDRVMPRIGDQKDLWEELKRVRLSAELIITDEIKQEVEQFLEELPRPIVLLHTRGTNWQERKSLPISTAFELVLRLIEANCSVVSIDYDSREPVVGHPRCRSLYPQWGKVSLDRLCALYEAADLMIGVDSGPFHLASFTNVKALGVFREIHPVRCCVPSPRSSYFVSRTLDDHWDDRCLDWNFLRYPNQEPTAEQIVRAAVGVMEGFTKEDATDLERTKQLAGTYLYRRLGYDERPIELLPNGLIGRGKAGCETNWSVRVVHGIETLTIAGDRSTCHLTLNGDGAWHGRWLHHERMPIELRKIQ